MLFWVYLSMMFSVTVTMLVVGKLFLLQVWYNRAFLHSANHCKAHCGMIFR